MLRSGPVKQGRWWMNCGKICLFNNKMKKCQDEYKVNFKDELGQTQMEINKPMSSFSSEIAIENSKAAANLLRETDSITH